MFEGAVAAFLNRLLGRYVEDLDTEHFNVGIFSGETYLTDLKLKPESLYQLGLPIRVEIGIIGKVSLKIPWTGLFTQPIILSIEDIYIVAVPATSGRYNHEIQKRLTRAAKKKILEDLEGEGLLGPGLPSNVLDSLMLSVVKNFQITVNNVHIRYEESFADRHVACGLCVQSFSMATTNNKWKPGVTPVTATSVYQLIRAESLSLYMDPDAEPSLPNYPEKWEFSNLLEWKTIMNRSLQIFGMNNKDFHFLIKPFTTKIKVIVNKSSEGQVSRMLVDVVLQDVAMQLSDDQFAALCRLWESYKQGSTERSKLHNKNHPVVRVSEDCRVWWKYAYSAVLEYNIKPYTWEYVQKHRKNYKLYKETFMHTLLRPNDTELKLDLQKYEDNLTPLNIIIAREHAKIDLKKKAPECVSVEAGQGSNMRLIVNCEKIPDNLVQSASPECKKPTAIATNDLENKFKIDKIPKHIDRKYNFTLANWSLSLFSNDHEIFVMTVTQFLASIETRPELFAYKISARAESFVIEGVSADGDLIPLVTADNILTGNVYANFLAIDFEKNPSTADFNYDINIRLEAFEVTYHGHAVREIGMFFKRNKSHVKHFTLSIHELYRSTKDILANLIKSIVSRRLRIHLKLDIKGPYIVFPELNSLQEGGNILLVDLGRMTFKSELQAVDVQLEDATLMELEELLYDRIHLVWTDAQVLISHSGDEWRESRKLKDSESHLIPKIQANVTLSCSIKPDYRLLPRLKLNVSFSNIKFNLSKGKLWHVCVFLNKMWIPRIEDIEEFRMSLMRVREETIENILITSKELMRVRSIITLSSFIMGREKSEYRTSTIPTCTVTESVRSVISSEFSEEDLEQWMRSLNLSGFDDNISPHNHVDLLLRIVIGELSFHAVTTSDGREKPYLVLRLCTMYFEAALMEYGPAFQFGVGSIVLADKTNAGITGSYLELISTDGSYDVISASYRKVKANCPDFKSHFRSIEQSLVLNITNLNIVFHRQAFLKLKHYCSSVMTLRYAKIYDVWSVVRYGMGFFKKSVECDPPVPPGAIKLSYSARLNSFVLRLCDKDSDFFEMKIIGAESDCVYNANQRMILRVHLRGLTIDDLRDITLYPKAMTTDEDGVFDLKYVRHSPKLYSCSDIGSSPDDVKSDGSFKLSVGKINCVLHSEMLIQCRYFMQPFERLFAALPIEKVKIMVLKAIEEFRTSSTKLHLSIDIQGPTLLFPQNRDNPSVLVFDMGILTIENFFKNNGKPRNSEDSSSVETHVSIIDNILIKLTSMTISRAIMTLAGVLKMQEPIVEPIQIRLDVKRNTEFRSMLGFQTFGLFEMHGSVDSLLINLGQKDFASIVNIWEENITKIYPDCDGTIVSVENTSKSNAARFNMDEAMVKKLEAFLSQEEQPICEISMKLTLDGLQLNLFSDTDEVLSSPVRDLNNGLGKLTFGEIVSYFDLYSNRSMTVKVSLRTCVLEDTRKEAAVIRKIIQSPAKSAGMNFESCVSVSEPPVFDFTFTQAPTGDRCIDMLVEETRVNLSIPFFLHLTRYFVDSLPHEKIEQGVVNDAFEDHAVCVQRDTENAQDSQDMPGTSVSIRVRKPEILIFADLRASNAHAILIQAELAVESSQHVGSSSIVFSLSNLLAKSKSQERYRRQLPQWVLRPCDVEISIKEIETENRVQMNVDINSINIHISPGIVYTLNEIIKEASGIFNLMDSKFDTVDCNQNSGNHIDLWSPKKVFVVPCKESIPYAPMKRRLSIDRSNHVQVFNFKPVPIHILLEMEDTIERIPMIKAELEIGGTYNAVDERFQIESSIKIHAFCYNPSRGNWEPLIELSTKDDMAYNSWELSIKMYHAEAYRLGSCCPVFTNHIKKSASTPKRKKGEAIDSEDDFNEDMIFIRPDVTMCPKNSDYAFDHEDDSDSNDDENSEKLARTFSHLFTKDDSEEEDNDSDASSIYEDEGLELTPEHVVETNGSAEVNNTLVDGDPLTTYVIISADKRIDFTITPNTISILETVLNTFTKSRAGIPIVVTNAGKLVLNNEIGHPSRIELRVEETTGNENKSRLIIAREYRTTESPVSVPSSPETQVFPDSDETSQFMTIENSFNDQVENNREKLLNSPIMFTDNSPMTIYRNLTEESLKIFIDGFGETLLYCPKWQGYKLVSLRPAKHEVRYHLIVEVSTDHHLHRTITVRSPLQIRNETSYALGLYYKKQLVEKLQLPHVGEALNPFDDNMRIAVIEPHDTYNVPLYITYHFPIHILPVHSEKFQVSDRGMCWRELSENINVPKDIYCISKEENCNSVFGVKVSCAESPKFVRTNCQVPQYLITIVPPLSFDNKLPFVIDINVPSIEYDVRIEPGERINVYSLKCDSDSSVIFKIQNYLGTQWTGTFKLNSELEKKFVKMFADSESDAIKPFVLCVELNKATSWTVVIYAQYWIINKTGLSLQIQESLSNTVDIPGEELIVFSQKKNRKKMIMLKAHQSDWSLPFNLDSISSMSLIACKDLERKRKYRILAEIATSNLSPLFTKIVTFLPYFYIKNDTKRTLRFMEENEDADLWNDLLPGQGIAFWPYTESMRMRLKWKSSQLVSQHFDVTKFGKIVLRMENGSALCVDVSGGNNSPFIVTFQKYQPGDAPVRVDNLCDDLFLKMNQLNLGQVALLSPFQSILYTWDDPAENRELVWNVYNSKTKGYSAQFHTDGYGQEVVTFRTLRRSPLTPIVKKLSQDARLSTSANSMSGCSSSDDTDSEADNESPNVEKVRKNRAVVYWISYMEKTQRVLLFTQDENIFIKAKSIVDPECSRREIFLALAGIGLSVVVESPSLDNKCRELTYACIDESAAHWEVDIGKRWKTLTLELSAWMEDKYKSLSSEAQFENFIDVNFKKMHMTKPFFGKLRRTYSPGVWLHVRKSHTLTYVQGYIHRIQIDNQNHDAVFPIILRPGSKKCFTNHSGNPRLKHCVEFSLLKQTKATYDVYKRINLVIREIHLELQEDFLIQLMEGLFSKKIETKHSIASRLKSDLSNFYVPLPGASEKLPEIRRKTVLEYLHVSPIKLHVKLLASAEAQTMRSNPDDYCNVIKSIFGYACNGTFLKCAEFRLPYFEKSGVTIDNTELLLELWQNYKAEMKHQYNVLVLSMTVLGNPYGYNFKSPGDRFYDTDTVMLQGDETAEMLSYDVSCFLGYTSMDGQPTSIINFNVIEVEPNRTKKCLARFESTETPEHVLLVDCSFSIGVELEMSGLIVKPTDIYNFPDTHQEELRYSLKNLGKGILSLTQVEDDKNSLKIKPGLILDTIKRAQEMGYSFVSRSRFPRYINPYSTVELYSTYKARGMHLLNTVRKTDYTNGESYWAHAALSEDGKHIALISLQRIYLIEKRCIWGPWTIAWTVEMKDLTKAPTVQKEKLFLHVNKSESQSSPSTDWYLESKHEGTLEWLNRKINTAMILNMEGSISPRFGA
ncbi:vacuolar protein sorting-associated protein 13A-like isoform X2 [Venturia canescens]|uniref:vacuolar protein sorting-associated protein 13A-like isoform X2 n=1 Tax=Venturia canescens TaxID=32260 RepID=UPI001C9C399A|nr:vacuolar protein sorting-associated protein 13A-like isoform X2 [Venturia canescens]